MMKKSFLIIIMCIVFFMVGIALTIFFLSRNTEANRQANNNAGTQVKLLEHAAPENGCLTIYMFDGEKTTWRNVSDKEWEHKVIDEINDLKLIPTAQNELLNWSEPCYGISICDSDGWEIWLTYSNGLWLAKDGSLYKGKYNLENKFNEAAGFDNIFEESSESGIRMPNAAILSKYDLKYCCKATNEVYAEKNGVSLRMISIDGDTATLEYSNNSDVDFTYGEVFTLQEQFDEWYTLPVAESNYAFNLPLYILGPYASKQVECYLGLYGKLDDGHYRIVKDDMCAVFDIPFIKAEGCIMENTVSDETKLLINALEISYTDFSQSVYEMIAKDWEEYSFLDKIQRIASSHIPGVCSRNFENWSEAVEFVGVAPWNPFENEEWLSTTNEYRIANHQKNSTFCDYKTEFSGDNNGKLSSISLWGTYPLKSGFIEMIIKLYDEMKYSAWPEDEEGSKTRFYQDIYLEDGIRTITIDAMVVHTENYDAIRLALPEASNVKYLVNVTSYNGKAELARIFNKAARALGINITYNALMQMVL